MAIKIHGEALPVQCINPIRDTWMITWKEETDEEDNNTFLSEIFEHKPSLTEIKEVILNWYNSATLELILTRFTWKNMPVWLSIENQFNYKAAYDVAIQTEGKLLPTFKFGTTEEPIYYTFKSINEVKEFYLAMTTYINRVILDGWTEKDNIDWEAYSNLL